MIKTHKCFWTPVFAVLMAFLLSFSVAKAQAETSYIIAHAHNPEGVEIASIFIMDPQCVKIYDGDTLIGYGPADHISHGKPIAITSGTHTIRAEFNGMSKERTVTLDPGETKNIVFTFERTEFDLVTFLSTPYHEKLEKSWSGISPPDWIYGSSSEFHTSYILYECWVIFPGSEVSAYALLDINFANGITDIVSKYNFTVSGPYSDPCASVYIGSSLAAPPGHGLLIPIIDSGFLQDSSFDDWYIQRAPEVSPPPPYPEYDHSNAVHLRFNDDIIRLAPEMVMVPSNPDKGIFQDVLIWVRYGSIGGSTIGGFVPGYYPQESSTNETYYDFSNPQYCSSVPYDLRGTGVKDECEVPEGEVPKELMFPPLVECPPGVTIQGPLVDREDEAGNKIQIFCEGGEFHMYYAPVGDSRRLIGRCPWWGGDNDIIVKYVETDEQNIECFLSTRWQSQEGNTKTESNSCVLCVDRDCILPQTEEEFIFPESYCPGPQQLGLHEGKAIPFTDPDGHIDWTEYEFNPSTSNLELSYLTAFDGRRDLSSINVEKRASNISPLIFDPPTNSVPILPADISGPSMILRQGIPCDLNLDRKCDENDFQIFTNALGRCVGEENYSRLADTDRDGCVTSGDQETLSSSDPDNDSILGFDDACPLSDLSPTVVIDSCDSGVVNTLLDSGCTISDWIVKCAAGARNHGKFKNCVDKFTRDIKRDGIITGREKGAIDSCADKADIP